MARIRAAKNVLDTYAPGSDARRFAPEFNAVVVTGTELESVESH